MTRYAGRTAEEQMQHLGRQLQRERHARDKLAAYAKRLELDHARAKAWDAVVALAERNGPPVIGVMGASAIDRMAEIVRAGVAALAGCDGCKWQHEERPIALMCHRCRRQASDNYTPKIDNTSGICGRDRPNARGAVSIGAKERNP